MRAKERLKQPDDNGDDYDDVENPLDSCLHRQVFIYGPEQQPDDGKRENQIEYCHENTPVAFASVTSRAITFTMTSTSGLMSP